MKFILLTFSIAAATLAAFAQQPDKALARVSYTFPILRIKLYPIRSKPAIRKREERPSI